jgi:hypothetical protein
MRRISTDNGRQTTDHGREITDDEYLLRRTAIKICINLRPLLAKY